MRNCSAWLAARIKMRDVRCLLMLLVGVAAAAMYTRMPNPIIFAVFNAVLNTLCHEFVRP